jgi:metal-dependent hydrolase (beta-lactamase superfamily II)
MSPLLALPPVDGVEITTIMDNSLDLLMTSTPLAHRFPLPHYGFIRDQVRAEHGVSLLITLIDQGKHETILFDTGVTPDGALHNLAVLGIDLGTIQAIVLSHGHTDHTHGLDGFLDKLGTRRMPILLHPDAFLKGNLRAWERRIRHSSSRAVCTWRSTQLPTTLCDVAHVIRQCLLSPSSSFLPLQTLTMIPPGVYTLE